MLRAGVRGRLACSRPAIERDRGRGGVEVAELRASRQVIDLVLLASRARSTRSRSRAELVARSREARCVSSSPSALRERDGVLVAAQRQEIVPVRMHRLRRVALVADRGAASGRRTPRSRRAGSRRCARSRAARPCSATAAIDVRPHLCEQREVARVAVDLGDQRTELAVAVVLRHRIGAALGRRSTAPCRSANWYGAYQLRKSRARPAWPIRSSARRSSRRRGSTSARRSAMPGWSARAVAIDQDVARARCAAYRPRAGPRAGRDADVVELSRHCAARFLEMIRVLLPSGDGQREACRMERNVDATSRALATAARSRS